MKICWLRSRFGTLKETLTGTGSGPLQTGTGAANDSSSIPFANGTRMDCYMYSTGQLTGIVNDTASYTCGDIAAACIQAPISTSPIRLIFPASPSILMFRVQVYV